MLAFGPRYGTHGLLCVESAVIPCESIPFAEGDGGERRNVPTMRVIFWVSSGETRKGNGDKESQCRFVQHDSSIKGKITSKERD